MHFNLANRQEFKNLKLSSEFTEHRRNSQCGDKVNFFCLGEGGCGGLQNVTS